MGPLARLATACARRPWIALTAWALIVGIAIATAFFGVTGTSLFDRLSVEAPSTIAESTDADDLLAGDDDNLATVTLLVHGVDVADLGPAIGDLADEVATVDGATFTNPLLAPDVPELATLISDDGRGVLLPVTIDEADQDAVVAVLTEARDSLRSDFPEATIEVGSADLLVESIVGLSQSDLKRGEGVALPIALLVMLVVFGGFIAAGVPLLGAIIAIIGAFGALLGATYLLDIDTTVVNVVTAVGLGLSIDYGLLLVSRFREEYRAMEESRANLLAAVATMAGSAGRTVLYSGITFATASVALLAFEPRIVRAIGVGALAVTIVAIASALTLIPALIGVSGDRLRRPGLLTRIPLLGRAARGFGDIAPTEGFFSRLTRRVQRHPAIITVIAALVLLALAAPALSLRIANTSVDVTPESSTQYTFVTTVHDEFPFAASPRVLLVTESEADALAWAQQVSKIDKVEAVAAPLERGGGWSALVQLEPHDGVDVVKQIRADRPEFTALVTGTDARTMDFSDSLIRGAPLALLILVLGTITMLFLMTGSLVVPLKALLMSTLSLGGSLGILVWGFQYGNFAELMNFDASRVNGVDVLVLVLTLAFGFGLAMDYEMFILSRIKEAVDAGVTPREAIAQGLQRSGRIITSAALIIVVVFAGFATGDLMVIKQLGVALAIAVILDATLVRCILVPAFMTWQQGIMWWAPRWMKRLHARFGLRDA